MKLKSLLASLAVLLLVGCSSVEVQDYSAEKPELDLATYFNGTIDA